MNPLACFRHVLGLSVVAYALIVASTARADTKPDPWTRAKDPTSGETYRLHVEVQRRLAQLGDVGIAQRHVLRTILEEANAEQSPDVRLRFDLGRVYLALGADDPASYDRAARVLRGALHDAPHHPMAEGGWLDLAFACGHTGEHECERNAYVAVLRLSTEDVLRVTPTLNLAETSMHLGNLQEAVEGYREALRLTGRLPSASETAPMAVWGMAVALDRGGDPSAAETQARFAVQLERSMGMVGPTSQVLHGTSVFFVPSYEIHWYDALSATVRAKDAKSREEAAYMWTVAERSWTAYVKQAEVAHDRWLEIARARLSAVSAARTKAVRAYATQRSRGSAAATDADDEVSL